jgi:hypothetical protein
MYVVVNRKRYLIPSPMTSCVNSKLKPYVLAYCCHHYGMTSYINTTATSALFLSCTHTHLQMCAHFVCDYNANPFPQFLYYVQVNMADTHITQAPTVFYLVPWWWRHVFPEFMLCWLVNRNSIITMMQILVSAIVRTSNFQVSKQWIPLLNQITSCFKSF